VAKFDLRVVVVGAMVVFVSRAMWKGRRVRPQRFSYSVIQAENIRPITAISKVEEPDKKSSFAKNRSLGRFRGLEETWSRRLEKIPPWLLKAFAFALTIFVVGVGFNVNSLPTGGPVSAMNLVSIAAVIFFGVVGIIPNTSSRFWSIVGMIAGCFFWWLSVLLGS
jgi:hypothetical protein